MSVNPRKIVAIAFDRIALFEFAIAAEVFGLPRSGIDDWYQFAVCAGEEGELSTVAGMTLDVKRGLRTLSTAGTIIVPGWRDLDERPPEPLLRALRRAHDRGARILSLCSGAFVLAAAGLLDGRRATTHWRFAEKLAQDFPAIEVDPEVLYIEDGSILTAAGSAAAIDLCLHVVRSDFGAEIANRVARRLVVPPHRDGGQAQFIDRPITECPDRSLARAIDGWRRRLTEEHSVESMAREAKMSARTFARRFREQTGSTPARWLTAERVQKAQHLLETTDHGIDAIAHAAGFSSAQLLRLHFQRVAGTTPSAYRGTFRGGSAPKPRRSGSPA